MAMYNLGHMYEYGLGVQKDGFMSKKWYQESMIMGPDGYIPCFLGLLRVNFKFFAELWKKELDASASASVGERVSKIDEELFKDEEREETSVHGGLSDWWFDGVMVALLCFAAYYLYTNQRPRPAVVVVAEQ